MDDLHNLIVHGGFDWHFKFKGKPMSIRITSKEMQRFYHMNMDEAAAIPPSTKTLLVHGSGDVTVPPYNAVRLARVIPNSQTRFLKDANHFYTKQHAQGVTELVKDFFEEEGFRGAPDPVDRAAFAVDDGFSPDDPDDDAPRGGKSKL